MTQRNILDADVSELGSWLTQGLAWWKRELQRILPGWMFPSASGRLVAVVATDGEIDFQRNGRWVRAPLRPERTWLAVGMDPSEVLTRTILLPGMSLKDLNSLLDHDLDRWMPFDPGRVYRSVRLGERQAGESFETYQLAVLPRKSVDAALAAVRAEGIDPYGVIVRLDDGDELVFPLDERYDQHNRLARMAWVGVAALVLMNVVMLVYRDMSDVSRLQQLADTQAPMAQRAIRLRSEVEKEQIRRVEISRGPAALDPMASLDALTRALPQSAWVQRLEWNARQVRITGYQDAGFDLAAALKASPLFTSPRLEEEQLEALPVGSRRPFEASAMITAAPVGALDPAKALDPAVPARVPASAPGEAQ